MTYPIYGSAGYMTRGPGMYGTSGMQSSMLGQIPMGYNSIPRAGYQTNSMMSQTAQSMQSERYRQAQMRSTPRRMEDSYYRNERSSMPREYQSRERYGERDRDVRDTASFDAPRSYQDIKLLTFERINELIASVESLPRPEDKNLPHLNYRCNEKSAERDIEIINQFLQDYGILALGDDMPNPIMAFDEAPFPPEIMEVIEEQKWQYPTEIQCITIPIALAGRDAIGVSKTGSGKTAAFVMPAIMHVKLQHIMGPTVLILVPTRELVEQIGQQIALFESKINVTHACVFGGGHNRRDQIAEIQRNPDIIVAVPGRLSDFLKNGIVNLSNVGYVVIDEADMMLEYDFLDIVHAILKCCQRQRQTLLWSATWPQSVRDLADEILQNPIRIVSKKSSVTINKNIIQLVKRVTESERFRVLTDIIKNILEETGGNSKLCIFANHKETVDEIAEFLNHNGIVRTLSTHAGKPMETRRYIVNEFRAMDRGACVGTNLLARGLDIKDITHVINYEFPGSIEDYVHRIGRTGRLIEGVSLTLFSESDNKYAPSLVDVLEKAEQKVPQWLRDAADAQNDKK